MVCFFDILKYMKSKFILFFTLGTLVLTGCNYKKPLDDFTFNNPSIQIADTLENVNNETAHIVFLFGQSNADGVSNNGCLEVKQPQVFAEYSAGYNDVQINFYNDGGNYSSNLAFKQCTLGCGCGDAYFGPEMGIAQRLHESHPTDKSFIIKWTWGGTNLRRQWLDGNYGRGTYYNSSMDFSIKCLDYLMSKGYNLSIDGICWMQGESDTFFSNASRYYKDTYAYVRFLRHDLKKYQEQIKFIDAAINEEKNVWVKADKINAGKRRFANESELNIYIDTNGLGLTTLQEPEGNVDKSHYDSESMVKLGQAFGDSLIGG